MTCLLGIDIGTSSCKTALFDEKGHVLVQASSNYHVYYPHPGWAEQDPDEWWEAVCTAIRTVLDDSGTDPASIAGIGIDGQSWSAIPIDREGRVLANTPIWMDMRAKTICARLNERIGADKIFDLAGNSLQPSYTTAKILWYKENMADMYGHIDKVLQSNSFIAYRLTGKTTQDLSQGYGLHGFNMRKGTWNKERFTELGIPVSFMPKIYASHEVVGYVTKTAAQKTGLSEGTPVVAGGLDACCGTLGAGAIHNKETQEQGGQAGGMSICTDTYVADPRLILSRHVVPGIFLLQGGTTGGGGVMRWIEQEFGSYERAMQKETGRSSLNQLGDLAEKSKPGSGGVIFLPYMSGERSPIWDPNAKGVWYGLDFSKTKGDMIRAAMEGTAFALRHNIEVAEAGGAAVSELRSIGGAANSVLWTQIKADVTGKPILVPSSDTATTLGAAILAGVGVGIYKTFDEAVEKTVHIQRRQIPNPENHEIYNQQYQYYLELYQDLKGLMKKTGGNEE